MALDDAEQNAQPFQVFCVESNDEDTLPCEVLDGLPVYSRLVLPISKCKKRIPQDPDQQVMIGHSYIDRKTKKGGIQVFARILDWQRPDQATATIGYYKQKYMSELKRVEMEKIDGTWVAVNLTVVIQS